MMAKRDGEDSPISGLDRAKTIRMSYKAKMPKMNFDESK